MVEVDEDTPSKAWQRGTVPLTAAAESYLCIFLWGEDNALYFDSISITEQTTSVRLQDLSAGVTWEIPMISMALPYPKGHRKMMCIPCASILWGKTTGSTSMTYR